MIILAITAISAMLIISATAALTVRFLLNYLIRYNQQVIEPSRPEIQLQKLYTKQVPDIMKPVDLYENDDQIPTVQGGVDEL